MGFKKASQIGTLEFLERFRQYATRNNPEMRDPTYKCHACRDIGYVEGPVKVFDHMKYDTMEPCVMCERGQGVIRGRDTQRMREKIKQYKRKARYTKDREILANLERRIDAGQELKPEDFRGLGDEGDE